LQVKATIIGRSPVAYVADGQTMHVVGPGDSLGARRVVAIDATGIVLDDGTRLELTGGYSAPSGAPVKALKRPLGDRRPPTISVPAAAATAVQTSEPPTTPAPLPTIRRGAFPVGTSPTSDPGAPTAFPYPYPYPPK
jgi:hypothetical protein